MTKCEKRCLPVSQDALLASDLMDKLDQPGHYTLFAPTDEAFDKLSPGYLERIMGDKTVIAGTLYIGHTNDVIICYMPCFACF